jgi:hypothetical protein
VDALRCGREWIDELDLANKVDDPGTGIRKNWIIKQ